MGRIRRGEEACGRMGVVKLSRTQHVRGVLLDGTHGTYGTYGLGSLVE